MNDGRYNCGPTLPSSCVPYTGFPLSSAPKDKVGCVPNINDIFFEIDKVVTSLDVSTDLTKLEKKCLNFNPDTIDVKGLNQIFIDEICAVKSKVELLEKDFGKLNILNHEITIDLTPLFGGLACNPTHKYTIGYILSVLVNEVANIKKQLK